LWGWCLVGVLSQLQPDQVFDAVTGFSSAYVRDWNQWVAADPRRRPELFGAILRKWQAVRPLRIRRLRRESDHEPPYLDDLLLQAESYLSQLGDIDVRLIPEATPEQLKALNSLWDLFGRLPVNGTATCVGISKAVLLLTNGRIGPALDSRVRSNLGIDRVYTFGEWMKVLRYVAADIAAFESRNGRPLREAVPGVYSGLEVGRLYDMALGPR
jgi:hypothetical protein